MRAPTMDAQYQQQNVNSSSGGPFQAASEASASSQTPYIDAAGSIDISNIPQASTPLGKLLQDSRPPPIPAFMQMLANMFAKQGQTIPERFVEGRKIDPYALFTVVMKFGGSTEVSVSAR